MTIICRPPAPALAAATPAPVAGDWTVTGGGIAVLCNVHDGMDYQLRLTPGLAAGHVMVGIINSDTHYSLTNNTMDAQGCCKYAHLP